MNPLLEVENLSVHFKMHGKQLKAVRDVSFEIGQKEIVLN